MLNLEFLEDHNIIPAIIPVDLTTGANTGDRVHMKNYERCVFVLLTAIGTAGDDPVISAQQHTAASGGTSADLLFTRIRHKVGATALSAVEDFTLVEQTAAASYDSDPVAGAENQAMFVIEIRASDLTDGYDWISFNVADVGAAAQLGAALYIMCEPAYAGATPPQAIA